MIAQKSLKRFKDKVRKITRRNRGVSLESVISDLNKIIPGWIRYFKLAKAKRHARSLDEWIRHKVRCYRLKQLKKTCTRAKTLISMGVLEWQAWTVSLSGKGPWRLSGTPQLHQALNLTWFKELGLYSLLDLYVSL